LLLYYRYLTGWIGTLAAGLRTNGIKIKNAATIINDAAF
jgi:hypothetical protein